MALQDSFAFPNVCFILYVALFVWFQLLVACYPLVAFDARGELCLLLDTRLNLGHGLRVDFHVGRSISIMFCLIVSVDSLCFLSFSLLWDDLTARWWYTATVFILTYSTRRQSTAHIDIYNICFYSCYLISSYLYGCIPSFSHVKDRRHQGW